MNLIQDLAELLRRVTPSESFAKTTLKKSEGCACILGHIYEITIKPLPVYEAGAVQPDSELALEVQSFYDDLAIEPRAQDVLKVLFPHDDLGMHRVEAAYNFNDGRAHEAVVTLVRDALARETAR